MFTRILTAPDQSMFLFGPRGTGKSTWIRRHFPTAVLYDLLDTTESLRLSRDPNMLYQEVHTLPPGSWVVVDEVQKVPELLNEVQRLIETKRLRFVLSGSSARKLRRGGTNLLAGRALVERLFPIVSAEVDFTLNVAEALVHGTLPMALTGGDPRSYLTSYAQTYLQEEIKAEALTRNIGHFARFLEVAARQNAQVTNVSAIARDAGVSRQTVQNYFEVLVDTLLGQWLQPWKLKRSTKQIAHPKFFLFDAGVARALSGRLPYPPSPEEQGPLMETFVHNEIGAYLSYTGRRYPLYFWRSYDGLEVDFFCETAAGFTAMEVKAVQRWDHRYFRGMSRLRDELGRASVSCYGVCLCPREASWDGIRVLPAADFLRKLWNGEIIP
jgi:predicted AAA+ superfamily ATPase